MKILKKDFDAAVSRRFDFKTCLVAQAMIREGILVESAYHPVRYSYYGTKAGEARNCFGANFSKPGDEAKPELQALRASLPIEL